MAIVPQVHVFPIPNLEVLVWAQTGSGQNLTLLDPITKNLKETIQPTLTEPDESPRLWRHRLFGNVLELFDSCGLFGPQLARSFQYRPCDPHTNPIQWPEFL